MCRMIGPHTLSLKEGWTRQRKFVPKLDRECVPLIAKKTWDKKPLLFLVPLFSFLASGLKQEQSGGRRLWNFERKWNSSSRIELKHKSLRVFEPKFLYPWRTHYSLGIVCVRSMNALFLRSMRKHLRHSFWRPWNLCAPLRNALAGQKQAERWWRRGCHCLRNWAMVTRV